MVSFTVPQPGVPTTGETGQCPRLAGHINGTSQPQSVREFEETDFEKAGEAYLDKAVCALNEQGLSVVQSEVTLWQVQHLTWRDR